MTILLILIGLSIILDLLILYNRDKAFAKKPLRYHIEVPEEYWGRVYGDKWYGSTYPEKLQIREDFLAELMESLTKEDTASALLTESWLDNMGKRVSVLITRLDEQEPINPYYWVVEQLVNQVRSSLAYLKRLFDRPVVRTKTYLRLASPDRKQNPEGFLLVIVAIFTTMLTIGMAALLFGCGKPDKPTQTRPTTVPRDTVRERLQREATAAVDTVKVKKERTSSTQKPYENAVFNFDSLRKLLPR